MKKSTWRKSHKWLGLILGFFLIMFCLSGIFLNHSSLIKNYSISRAYLPIEYQYKKWNNGLLRGTKKWGKDVIVYGYSGLWLTDSYGKKYYDFNKGLPVNTDYRSIRGIVETPSHQLFMVSQYDLYTLTKDTVWQKINLPGGGKERLSDITVKGDSLIIVGRSCIYLSIKPYNIYSKIMLAKPTNYDGKASLFVTVRRLHTGGLFGFVGKIIVDFIGIVLIFLTISGIVYWFIKRRHSHGSGISGKKWLRWHNYIGRISIVFTLFVSITGWFLHPPAVIAIASGRVPIIPYSSMDTNNPWKGKLRILRYDRLSGDWLLHTTEGFYTMTSFNVAPKPLSFQPPISVMGINVMEQKKDGTWLIGSFSGMYEWNRKKHTLIDYFTHQPAKPVKGKPFGAHAVSGYSSDFACGDVVVDYKKGCNNLVQPQWMSVLPMSLRSICLEVHTGRIYTFLGLGTILYIFIVGLGCIWCLWSGWKIRENMSKRCKKKSIKE